jgi:HPt (histidine-containing phosphotransfer) domain-containing protein
MTTHQQHCIEAGMDTHLAKPFLRDELFAAIAGGLGIANAAIEIRPHDNDDYDGMLLDAAIVMDLIEDGLFADLLRSFDSQSAARLQALSDAYAANTPTSVAAMAHRLRSPAATMGFAALTTTCAKLEYAANAGVLLDARHLDSVRALTRASSAAAQEFIRLQTLHPNPR